MVKYSSLVMPCVMPGAVLLIALFASVDPVICGNELVMCQQDVNSLRQMSRVERDNFPNPEHMDREHRAAISLSGGEAPGVNAYDAFLAAELAARGISLEALQYGLDTFDAKDDADFAKGLLWIDRDRADRTGLMPGADTGTSRVNIDEKNEPLLEAKLRRLSKRCKYLFQKGGNDHLDQARKLGEFCKKHDIDLVVIGLPKTIDYDTKGVYPIGSRTAGEEMHDMVRRAAAPVGSGKCSIVQVMGRDMGMLAALAADDDPTYLVALPEWGADLTKLRAAVRNRMKKYGACTLILSEGFKIAGNDPVFKEVLDSERGAFLKYKYETISTKVDAHLNTLVTELGIADFIAEALAMDAQMSLVRDRNLTIQDGGYAIRDVTPNALDIAVAREAARVIGELISVGPGQGADPEKLRAIRERGGVCVGADWWVTTPEEVRATMRVRDFSEVTAPKEKRGTVNLATELSIPHAFRQRLPILGRTVDPDTEVLPEARVAGAPAAVPVLDMIVALRRVNSVTEAGRGMRRPSITVIARDDAAPLLQVLKKGVGRTFLSPDDAFVTRSADDTVVVVEDHDARDLRSIITQASRIQTAKKRVHIVASWNFRIHKQDAMLLQLIEANAGARAIVEGARMDADGFYTFGSRLVDLFYIAMTEAKFSGIRKTLLGDALNAFADETAQVQGAYARLGIAIPPDRMAYLDRQVTAGIETAL